ncbi:MAG: hypothetical protein RLZZ400_294 [Actinomycetota bacterium]
MLILRHENALSSTTDVATHAEFASRRRAGFIDGVAVDDWFSEDFTFEEIQILRAIERLPELRPGSKLFDGQFLIPTLSNLLTSSISANRTLILELKHGAYFQSRGIDVVELMARELEMSDWKQRGVKLIFEAFNLDVLRQMRDRFGDIGKYVYLIDQEHLPEQKRYVSDDFLRQASEVASGVSLDIALLLGPKPAFGNADFGSPTGVVERAQAIGLDVYTWTARAEEAVNSVEEYYHHFVLTGADGIFADHPDLLLNCVS